MSKRIDKVRIAPPIKMWSGKTMMRSNSIFQHKLTINWKTIYEKMLSIQFLQLFHGRK